MTAIRIHGVPPSTFTRTVRLACHEKGIDYELVPTMPSEITALNPFRKIPAVTHGDLVLFESTAILRYLERTFAGPKLWPDDSAGIALCDQWVSAVCDSLVNAALRYMASRYGFLPVPGEMQRQYLDKTREVVPIFDRQLGKTRYLAGDGVTASSPRARRRKPSGSPATSSGSASASTPGRCLADSCRARTSSR